MTSKQMTWFGGKPAGCLAKRNNHLQVIFGMGARTSHTYITEYFPEHRYGSMEKAEKVAKRWQEEKSFELNLTKNRIRIVESEDEEMYLEVELQNDKIMKCDVEDIDLVEESIWTAWRSIGKKCWYVRRRESKKRDQKYAMFHTLVCPQYTQIDHINRDSLDNRRHNLREGKEVNAKNKGIQINNRSGITGVYYERNHWIAQIGTNKDRKRCSFSINVYGSEEAKRMAIKQRKEWEKQLEYNAAEDETLIGVRYQASPKSIWVVQIGTGKNRKRRTFSTNKYGYEEAKQMAIEQRKEWLIEQ